MRVFNDSVEYSVGVSSIDQGEWIGSAYSGFLPPSNGLIVQGSVGIGSTAPERTFVVQGSERLTGSLYDFNNFVGIFGYHLVSTGAGIAWSSIASSGINTGTLGLNQVAYGQGNNAIQGSNNLWFTGSSLGVGTSSLISRVVIQSPGISSSVLRIQGLSGTLFEITDNLVGVLDQVTNISGLPILQVNDGVSNPNIIIYARGVGQTVSLLSLQTSGSVISSFSTSVAYFSQGQKVGIGTNNPYTGLDIVVNTRLTGALYDINNTPGPVLGVVTQYLSSTGTGVTWVPVKRTVLAQLFTGVASAVPTVTPSKFILPYDSFDGATVVNYTLKNIYFKVDAISTTGISTIQIFKGTGNGIFIPANVLNVSLTTSGFFTSVSVAGAFTAFGATGMSQDQYALKILGLGVSTSLVTVQLLFRET